MFLSVLNQSEKLGTIGICSGCCKRSCINTKRSSNNSSSMLAQLPSCYPNTIPTKYKTTHNNVAAIGSTNQNIREAGKKLVSRKALIPITINDGCNQLLKEKYPQKHSEYFQLISPQENKNKIKRRILANPIPPLINVEPTFGVVILMHVDVFYP